jgi:large subunit ribosomal protein L32e
MVKPATRVKVLHKRTKKFIRHHADRYMRVPEKWRKPKGIDSRVRRQFRSNIPLVRIGYGTKASHRHLLQNGFRKFPVYNVNDLNVLLMQNTKLAAEIGHAVSIKTRKAIIEKARLLDIKVLNERAKLRSEDNE